MVENQTTIFEMLYPTFKITKTIRLITLFSGYDSQCLALKYLGANYEHYKTCEWAVKSIQALKDLHFENDSKDYSKELSEKEIKEYLFSKGISSNYNDPMTKEQVNRLNEKAARTIYNNIKATHNLVNIQQVKGKDLEIVDTDKYDYILTYSFPCQDLSLSGKRKGMSDTSTRSGMLWEVERVLNECEELGELPQVLLMENVPQVKTNDPIAWNKWTYRLEQLGYKNYCQDLIATDYGIPQTRNRTFMISILGDYNYTFPKPIPLKLKLKDMLEENVSDKYYLSDNMKQYIFSEDDKYKVNKNSLQLNREIACSKTTREGNTRDDTSDYIIETCLLKNKGTEISRLTEKANTLMARDYKGFGNQEMNGVIQIRNATKQGYLEATEGDDIDLSQPNSETRRGRVQKEQIQTLTTQNNLGVVINNNIKNVNSEDKTFTTLGTNCGSSTSAGGGVVLKNDLRIRKLTPRECFRLMGVKDEDFDKVAKNQSDSSLYHLAGDSIVVDVIKAIFKEML